MTSLEREFRWVIRDAVRKGDHKRAQEAREYAAEKYDMDLLDYLVEPS